MTTRHLWSGRFTSEPNAEVFAFGRSFRFDRRLLEDDVRGSVAWAHALEEAGVLNSAERADIVRVLRAVLERYRADPAWLDGDDEDVHAFVERQLVAQLGDTGRRLHTGRSRNEQVSLDLRLYLRRRVPLLQEGIARLVSALANQAEAAGDAVMPAYTHLRRAQPVLVAHFFLAHAAALRRDAGRFQVASDEADALPLGSGAIAGAAYPIDTAALAARLGFSRVVANSLDAAGDRDFVVSFLYASALAMVHLSRLAEDLILFTSEEFGFFELADAVATGSSLMPQKKNPDPLELIRGKTGRTLGHLTGLLATLKGVPSGYNKDLQEDKEAAFDAESTVLGALDAATIVVATLHLDRPKTERAASGLLLATTVADYLVERGMPFRQAHELVGAIVQQLEPQGRTFESLALAEWQTYSALFGADLISRLTPQAAVGAQQTPQSTRPDAVAAALADVKAWVAQQRSNDN
jgi:argininosuccinate lyase